ncbi:uncharacterized protein LOC142141416 [Mixophyes fleayi]|uniref:uncharacterized protein LOC142141416 n=1 Tax=Mixophyes fleayi TaxID=3061075 RepID=UPI003F4DE7D7
MSRERRDSSSSSTQGTQEEIVSSGEEWRDRPEERQEERRRQQFVSSVQASTSTQQQHLTESGSDDEEGPSVTRSRRFTLEENEVLVAGVLQHYETLKGAQSLKASFKHKQKIWSQIASAVSAVGVRVRSVAVCMKRFRDCKRTTKAKMAAVARHSRGTGGGKPLRLKFKPWEKKMRQILSDDLVEGVEGTVDTLDPSTFQPREQDAAQRRRHESEAVPRKRKSKSGDLGSSQGHKGQRSVEGEGVTLLMPRQVAVEVATTASNQEKESRLTKSTHPAQTVEPNKKAHKRRRVTEVHVSEPVADVQREGRPVEEMCEEGGTSVTLAHSREESIIPREQVVTPVSTFFSQAAMEEIASPVCSVTEELEHDSQSLTFSPVDSLVHEDAATRFEMLQQAFPNLQVPTTEGEGPSQARVPSTGTSLPTQLVHGLPEQATQFHSITDFARKMEGRQETSRRNMEDRVQRIGDSVDRLTSVVEEVRSSRNTTNSLLERLITVHSEMSASIQVNNNLQTRMAAAMEQNTAVYYQMNQSMAQMHMLQQQQTMHLQMLSMHVMNISEELRLRRVQGNVSVPLADWNISGFVPPTPQQRTSSALHTPVVEVRRAESARRRLLQEHPEEEIINPVSSEEEG